MGAVLRWITFQIDVRERVGERLRVDGHLARTGVQTYTDVDGAPFHEYRPPEEVFADAALASFRGMPVTIGHPSQMVTPTSWREVAVGHVGDDVHKANDGRHVAASLWLQDAKAIKQVEAKQLSELSVGYHATLELTAGTSPDGEQYDAVQRDIFGNHVALLPRGHARGGATVALRLDSNRNQVINVGAADEGDSKMKFLMRVDGRDFEIEATDNSILDALEKERAEGLKQLAEEKAEHDADKAKLDAAQKRLDEIDEAARIAELDALTKQVMELGVEVKAGEKLDALDLRRRALDVLGVEVKDRSDAYVEARFDAEIDRMAAEAKTTHTDTTAPRRALHDSSTVAADTDMTPASLDASLRALGGF